KRRKVPPFVLGAKPGGAVAAKSRRSHVLLFIVVIYPAEEGDERAFIGAIRSVIYRVTRAEIRSPVMIIVAPFAIHAIIIPLVKFITGNRVYLMTVPFLIVDKKVLGCIV